MTDDTPLEFTTVCNEVPVTIDKVQYYLREATGDAASRYVNARVATMRLGKGDVVGMGNIGDLAPLLVSLTLFDENGKNVPESVVRKWPNKVQEALYDRSLDLSHLRDVNSQPIASLQRSLDKPGAPVDFKTLYDWIDKNTDKLDDKPLRLMLKAHMDTIQKEDEEGNS